MTRRIPCPVAFRPRFARLCRPLTRFARADDGAAIILGLFLFIAMVFVSGMAVDLMRYENQRQHIQGTADRAAVAATMLRGNPEGVTPEQIVRRYFEAEGLGHLVAGDAIQVSAPQNGQRTVTINPTTQMDTIFMRMLNIPQLDLSIRAQAVEGVGQLPMEIVMVLDVSGSMAQFNRMENLQIAARDFANTMLADNASGRVALTIVPYSTEVILPDGMLNMFPNLAPPRSGNMTNAFCSDFERWNIVRDGLNARKFRRNCDLRSNTTTLITDMPVRPYMHDPAAAVTYINTLGPNWGTSIDLGVRMGALFFDPTIRPAISHLINIGQVSNIFQGRPLAWEDRSIRAMILMTDGENCCFHPGHAATRKNTVEIQDADTIATCNALKDQGVIIYGVAFEAPPRGEALMAACASSEGHYFNSSGTEVINAFRAIATHVQTEALRLTE